MSDESSEENNNEKTSEEFKEFVKIYSNDSKLIPLLGSVFHNKKSRAMWLLLCNTKKEFYLKEMAAIIENNENPRLPNYEYHIGIMVEAGIVLVRIKLHNKHKTKFYRAAQVIMLTTPQLYEKASKSKTLKTAFHKVFKFAAVGSLVFLSWFQGLPQKNLSDDGFDYGASFDVPFYEETTFFPMLIIILALIINSVFNWQKKKKKSLKT